jgi:hypothetical protein
MSREIPEQLLLSFRIPNATIGLEKGLLLLKGDPLTTNDYHTFLPLLAILQLPPTRKLLSRLLHSKNLQFWKFTFLIWQDTFLQRRARELARIALRMTLKAFSHEVKLRAIESA